MTCFSAAPMNIILTNSNKNYRRYNVQVFANISGKFPEKLFIYSLQHTTKLALQTLYMLWTGHPSVCPSVRPSVCHTPVLCQKEETQKDAIFITR